MRQIVLFLIMCISVQLVAAQGINFTSGDFEEIVKQAGAEKKGIFVDVYTSWCGPCKMMAKNVFTDENVGAYYNTHFVCVKLDAEKQSKHGFFKRYKAGGYPSFFWLNEKGDLLDLHVGYLEAPAFIEKGKASKDSDFPRQLAAMKERWEGGERSIELVKSYVFGALGRLDPVHIDPEILIVILVHVRMQHELLYNLFIWRTHTRSQHAVSIFRKQLFIC